MNGKTPRALLVLLLALACAPALRAQQTQQPQGQNNPPPKKSDRPKGPGGPEMAGPRGNSGEDAACRSLPRLAGRVVSSTKTSLTLSNANPKEGAKPVTYQLGPDVPVPPVEAGDTVLICYKLEHEKRAVVYVEVVKYAERCKDVQEANGNVVSISQTSLVLEETSLQGKKQFTFLLNDKTQRSGALEPGAQVRVCYQDAQGGKTAVSVSVRSAQ